MSAIDERTVDPAKPHPSPNMGHEMSDFSWTSVLWLLPISVILLVAFTLVCLFWFRGAKTTHVLAAEVQFSTDELKMHRAKEAEFLNEYKYLDKDAGRVRIPIARAMELVAQESRGKGTVDWKPVTDAYMLGAAFAVRDAGASGAAAPVADGIEMQAAPAAPAQGREPAQKAQEKQSEEGAPGGGAGTDPKKAAPAKEAGAPAKAPAKGH